MTSQSAMQPQSELGKPRTPWSVAISDSAFLAALSIIGAAYILLILSMLAYLFLALILGASSTRRLSRWRLSGRMKYRILW